MLLFTAYNSVQNLSSSIVAGALGYWAIAATYITLCVCCFFVSGAIVARMGSKLAMLCGASCYSLFLLANRFPAYYTLIPTAALTGFGASLVWIGQGAYITACSRCYSIENRHDSPQESIGSFLSFFLLVFQLSQVFGNLLSSFVLDDTDASTRNTLIYIFLGLSVLALVLLALLKSEPEIGDSNAAETLDATPSPSSPTTSVRAAAIAFLLDKVLSVIPLLGNARMRALVPSFVASGCLQSFIFGSFTADIIKPSLGTSQIGYVMAIYGVVQLFVLFGFGAAGDRFGKAYVAYIGYTGAILLFCAYHVVTNIYSMAWLGAHSALVYVSSALFAVADCSLYLFIKVMVSSLYPDRAAHAYSLLQFFKSLAMAMSFATGPYFSLGTKLLVFLCVSLVGLGSTIVLFSVILPNETVDLVQKRHIEVGSAAVCLESEESMTCEASNDETNLIVVNRTDTLRF